MEQDEATRRRSPTRTDLHVRRAPVRAKTFNRDTGAFTAVIATSTPVQRRDETGAYFEVLSISPRSIRLDRLKSGAAPVLDSHRSGSARDQIGSVIDARIENGELVADARLSPRDDVKPIATDLEAGIAPNVSVGYRVYASVESRDQSGNLIITHTDWEPYEMSLVAIPADPNAYVRNLKGQASVSIRTTNIADDDLNENDSGSNGTATVRSADDERAPTMSTNNIREAYRIAEQHDIPLDLVRRHIDSGGSMRAYRELVFDRLASEANKTRSGSRASAGSESFDNPDFLNRSISDALYSKMTGSEPKGGAAELAGRSMLELGAMILQSRGERVSWANRSTLADQILTRSGGGYHTTSDFSNLLANAGNRVLSDAYQVAQTPLKNLARRRTAADFRPISMLRLSEAPRLERVAEGGEVKHGTRVEAKEGFKVDTYARIFGITRQAIINDDLGAFADTAADFGRAAASTEADLMAALLLANGGDGANLADGDPVYSAARGNKASAGAAITVASLGAGRKVLRDAKDIDGITPLNVAPRHLVVGSAKETEAEQVLHELSAVQVDEVNPFAGKLSLQVEPRLAGNAWRLFADPAQLATIVIAYLAGREGPQIDIREGWDVLGVEFRAVLDFGCAMQDWRGTYLNPGA